MARTACVFQMEIDEMKAKLDTGVQEKESLDTQEQMDYNVETLCELREKALSKRLRNEIHINKNFSDRLHA